MSTERPMHVAKIVGSCTKCSKPVPLCPLCLVETMAEDVLKEYGAFWGNRILNGFRDLVRKKFPELAKGHGPTK